MFSSTISAKTASEIYTKLEDMSIEPNDQSMTDLNALNTQLQALGTKHFSKRVQQKLSRATRKLAALSSNAEPNSDLAKAAAKARYLVDVHLKGNKAKRNALRELALTAYSLNEDVNEDDLSALLSALPVKDVFSVLRKQIPKKGEISLQFLNKFIRPTLKRLNNLPPSLVMDMLTRTDFTQMDTAQTKQIAKELISKSAPFAKRRGRPFATSDMKRFKQRIDNYTTLFPKGAHIPKILHTALIEAQQAKPLQDRS
jgi:hypothetical protein